MSESDGSQYDGFSINPATFAGVAGKLGKAYDDLNIAVEKSDLNKYHQANAFGDLVSEAWWKFNTAWAQEMNVTIKALKELIEKTHPAVQSYAKADSSAEHASNNIMAILEGIL